MMTTLKTDKDFLQAGLKEVHPTQFIKISCVPSHMLFLIAMTKLEEILLKMYLLFQRIQLFPCNRKEHMLLTCEKTYGIFID
jgi:hypothetical protein